MHVWGYDSTIELPGRACERGISRLLSIRVDGGGALLSCVGYRVVLCVGVIQGC